ncbi:peptide-methionine (S)-S-oxide reductase MsrA [Gammaproteobacteria bacterium]|nr:peptide-methionine (S)-S-oxide reductase MsrA [Gammaproteobacteria bacterium]
MFFRSVSEKMQLPTDATAAPDRDTPVKCATNHFVSGNVIQEPIPAQVHKIVFGMGCFWGAERLFWTHPGVYSTAVGYSGGITANPTYEDVCSGLTGHTEVVLVFYDYAKVDLQELFSIFWESHNPTEGMRQGNDTGTQYRSAIYTTSDLQMDASLAGVSSFQSRLTEKGYPEITTEIRELEKFYYAEDYHQQYLAKNPGGYCGISGTGVKYAY